MFSWTIFNNIDDIGPIKKTLLNYFQYKILWLKNMFSHRSTHHQILRGINICISWRGVELKRWTCIEARSWKGAMVEWCINFNFISQKNPSRRQQTSFQLKEFYAMSIKIENHVMYVEATPHEGWREAMAQEIKSIKNDQTWTVLMKPMD